MFVVDLFRRFWTKLKSIIPLVIGALLVVGVFWLILRLVTPYLPEDWRQVLALLDNGEVSAARDELSTILKRTGTTTELAFMGLQALQVIIAPIPGQLAGLVGGYLFGFWYGLLLTMTGLALGSLVAISLGRWLGKLVVRKFVPARFIAKFDALINRGGLWNFFFIFLLPVFPDDAACLLAGLTQLRVWKLVGVCLAGRLPGMAVLTYVGSGAGAGSTTAYVVFGVAMVLSLFVWLYSEEIERWCLKQLGRKKPDPPSPVQTTAPEPNHKGPPVERPGEQTV
jgi:uncharacterized membrane protein YdjX (TVP38/TMEM64 family)